MKKIVSAAALLISAASLFAYNPPAGGQSLFTVSNPNQLAGAGSACGGAIFAPGPDSIAFNPALPAMEDRIQLDLDFTGLISTADSEHPFNPAFDLGLLVPLKMFTVSGFINGDFCNSTEMNTGSIMNMRAGLSKSVTDKISVGMNLYTGFLMSPDFDWSLGADLGVLCRLPYLGFLRDARLGVSVMNLGKNFTDVNLPGIKADSESDFYPGIATVKAGVAATLLDIRGFKIGASFDLTSPAFQDLILDAGLQLGIKDMVFLKVGENFDIAEVCNGHTNYFPSVGLSVKFNFNASNSQFMQKNSWDKSEMMVSGAWQQKYDTIQAVSGGVRIKLGQKDETPPAIKLWDDDDEVLGL